MGKLTRHRAILIHPKISNLKIPSDLNGLTLLSYAPASPPDLADRLKPACEAILKIVKLHGVRTP
jgi:predicted nucleotide-binding protein